uniref:Uncharacterized protein n=1 Tax=Aegilops tauschii subsp. strangulata TaxID=200361 RepID=A0A453RPH7_AEGTS
VVSGPRPLQLHQCFLPSRWKPAPPKRWFPLKKRSYPSRLSLQLQRYTNR